MSNSSRFTCDISSESLMSWTPLSLGKIGITYIGGDAFGLFPNPEFSLILWGLVRLSPSPVCGSIPSEHEVSYTKPIAWHTGKDQ